MATAPLPPPPPLNTTQIISDDGWATFTVKNSKQQFSLGFACQGSASITVQGVTPQAAGWALNYTIISGGSAVTPPLTDALGSLTPVPPATTSTGYLVITPCVGCQFIQIGLIEGFGSVTFTLSGGAVQNVLTNVPDISALLSLLSNANALSILIALINTAVANDLLKFTGVVPGGPNQAIQIGLNGLFVGYQNFTYTDSNGQFVHTNSAVPSYRRVFTGDYTAPAIIASEYWAAPADGSGAGGSITVYSIGVANECRWILQTGTVNNLDVNGDTITLNGAGVAINGNLASPTTPSVNVVTINASHVFLTTPGTIHGYPIHVMDDAIGFFGVTPTFKQEIGAAIAGTASGSYTSTEQGLINDLVANVNTLSAALNNLGLTYS